ncbi:MAG: hypothetical protein MUO67_24555 [Anaerolineales bacterium]|nr:hypothetical protein [Anaerolineales bacterium]
MNASQTVRAGAVCALAASAMLVVMAIVGLPAGEGMAIVGQPGLPDNHMTILSPYADTLQVVMALDNIFLIAYTGAFIGAAALVWRRARLLGVIGLGFALLLALLDISENAVTVNIARAVETGVPVALGEITLLGLLEQIKYAAATLAVVYLAIALLIAQPASRGMTWVTAVVFLLFPVVNAVTVVNPGAKTLLIRWMLLMLLASAVLLWRSSQDK